MNLSEMIKFRKGRIAIINATHVKSKDNWQSNATPVEIVNKMLDKTPLENKEILVMFNLEFLECMIHDRKLDKTKITFLADSLVEQLIAQKVYKVKSFVVTEKDFKTKTFLTGATKMQFDLVLTNPPYNGNIDLKILQEVRKIANEIICVHPSTWVIDLKGKAKLYKDFKEDLKLKSVELFNGNPVFNIGLFVPCMITHIDNNYKGNINVNFFDDKYKVTSIDDITKFGKDWTYIVKPFMQTIETYIQSNGSIWINKIDNTPNVLEYQAQLASMIGNWDKSHKRMVCDDFYTMTMIDSEGNKGVRLPKSGCGYYSFKTEVERDNFIKYTRTDFARYCLSLLKNKADLHRGELEIVPWMDFTQEWNDEKLFALFGIDQEMQDYIRAVLPDYHGIRGIHSVTVNGVKFQHKEIRELAKDIASHIGPKTIYEARQRQLSISGESPLVTGEIIQKEKPTHNNPTREKYSDPPSKMITQDGETWYLFTNHGIPKMKQMIEKMCELTGMTCQFN
jgi:hypothetical protein